MRLLLIRHGETVDNVAQVYAGTRDSPLTSHGALQASRLGSYLASKPVKISSIFSSDLQRAFKTAEAIRLAQPVPLAETIQSKLLREKDFGSYEGRSFAEIPRDDEPGGVRVEPGFKKPESKAAIALRMNEFIDSHLAELLTEGADEDCVAIVSHGIALSYLWRACIKRFPLRNVVLAWGLTAAEPHGVMDTLGIWHNTGYMDLEIRKKPILPGDDGTPSEVKSSAEAGIEPTPPLVTDPADVPILKAASFANLLLTVKGSNCRDHLRDLKRTRGGLGSMEHDARQTSLDSFVKRRKI